jgi:hypothetical protein
MSFPGVMRVIFYIWFTICDAACYSVYVCAVLGGRQVYRCVRRHAGELRFLSCWHTSLQLVQVFYSLFIFMFQIFRDLITMHNSFNGARFYSG